MCMGQGTGDRDSQWDRALYELGGCGGACGGGVGLSIADPPHALRSLAAPERVVPDTGIHYTYRYT